jgi:vacuolar-type H+-ATPase subunit E/Vma4
VTLKAVRRALMDDADADAGRVLAAAREEAEAQVAAALHEARRMTGAARAEGDAEARTAAAIEQARVRRRAREAVLAARQAAVDRLRAAAREAAVRLRDDPRYPELLAGLERTARDQLGEGATVDVQPPTGGLVAAAGSRSVDYRLDSLADRCVDALGEEIEALWR